jgi:signal transduction histidine kinase/CheY-like chemotaxis protein
MDSNINKLKSKFKFDSLFLFALTFPTLLIIIAEIASKIFEMSGIYYTVAGTIFGCGVLGILFILGGVGNKTLWSIYTPYALLSAFYTFTQAVIYANSDFKFPIWFAILNEHIFNYFSDLVLILMPLVINKVPIFKLNEKGKKRLSGFYLLYSGVLLVFLIQIIPVIIALSSLNENGMISSITYSADDVFTLVYKNEATYILSLFSYPLLLSPLLVSSIYFLRRELTIRREKNGEKNSIASVLFDTVNGNVFLVCVILYLQMIPALFIDTNWLVVVMYPCLILLAAFINDMRRTKDQLQLSIIAEQEAERANKEKSSFLANMSHEIRTPINGILGITQIELDKNPSDEMRRTLDIIYSSGRSLLDLINDILDFSKIESGKIDIVNLPYDFGSMINDTILLNVTRIGSKPIEFIADIDPNIPAEPIGDYVRIKQILNNLLSNAFKYTAEGEVKLSVKTDGQNIVFAVSDTGQGLSPESVKKLGQAYTRFNANANANIEGTGLGMNITRKLIDKMGGTLEVQSELGKGSTFTVILPQEFSENTVVIGEETAEKLHSFNFVSARSVADISEVTPMPYGKVLVVDDNATNLFVAEGLLAEYKLNITTVSSGFAAIDKVKEGNTYDIIFMDHMMPEMDGVETVKRLREGGYSEPIVALTANALNGIDKMFLENGFDGFISKPIDKKSLKNTLIKFIEDRYPEEAKKQTAATSETSSDDRSKKLTELFLLDAQNALKVLPESADNDIKLFAITAHAMKSALANMGNMPLSERAKTLEFAGKDENKELIRAELPGFLGYLKAYVDELSPKETVTDENINGVPEDKISALITALDNYDEKAANAVIDEIKAFAPGLSVLSEISLKIMVSEFEEAAELALQLKNCKPIIINRRK